MRLSSYLQDEEPFYAHGRPKEQCQQKLTDARRGRRRKDFPLLDCTRTPQGTMSAEADGHPEEECTLRYYN